MDFATRLKRAREAAGVSQYALAKLIDSSQPFVNELESGRKNPSLQTVERICQALGLTPGEFFADRSAPESTLPPDLRRILDTARLLSPRQRELLLEVMQEWVKMDQQRR